MTHRTLTFAPCKNADGQPSGSCRQFALFVNLFLTGGNILHYNPQTGPTSRSRADQKMEAQVLRGYKAISDALPDTTPLRRRDDQPGALGRSLKSEGGTITLEQSTFVLVEKYLDAAPSGTQDADAVDDLKDWVSAADKD